MAIQITAKFNRSPDFGINVDLDLEGNQITALFGKSGSGKSSILRFVAGFEKIPNNLSIDGYEYTIIAINNLCFDILTGCIISSVSGILTGFLIRIIIKFC